MFAKICNRKGCEEERLQKIEQKSIIILFLGSFSFIFSNTLVFIGGKSPELEIINIVILILVNFYLLGSVIFCLKVLDRDIYHSIDIEDYREANIKKIILKYEEYSYLNSLIINKKVEWMSTAHYWFLRFIILSGLFFVFKLILS